MMGDCYVKWISTRPTYIYWTQFVHTYRISEFVCDAASDAVEVCFIMHVDIVGALIKLGMHQLAMDKQSGWRLMHDEWPVSMYSG